MSEKFDVEDALTTDKYALDDEWLRQPYLMEQANILLADVEYKRDRAKAKLSYEKAKLGNIIRSDPDEYNIEGTVTDGKVKEIVAADNDIYELERKYHEWEAEVTATDGVKWAVGQRKAQLENLTKLFLSGYWAKPHVSEEDKEEIRTGSNYDQTDHLRKNSRLMAREDKEN